ncbi:UDP-glucose 4-epimerase [Candidatus Shapirobacteria bacterium]|nr:UDP-glucose 4-epimerase [Candidatus Shapirobacteria bacterium]
MTSSQSTKHNILVTGGAGFLGSCLVDRLSNCYQKVVVVDNLSVGKKENLSQKKNVIFYKKSITDVKALDFIFRQENITDVIHLAAIHYIPYCNEHVGEVLATNVMGTGNILAQMQKHQVKRFIFASSAAVYQPNKSAHSESDPLEPVDIYGVSKLVCENLIGNFSKTYQLQSTILRFFNIYGDGDLVPHLIPELIRQAYDGNTIKLGRLDSMRDYIHKEDVAQAVLDCFKNSNSVGKTYNVGSQNAISVKQVFDYINDKFGNSLKIEIEQSRKRGADASVLLSDTSKIRQEIGWSPKNVLKSYINNLPIDSGKKKNNPTKKH